jgi:predicted transcriptional regulator
VPDRRALVLALVNRYPGIHGRRLERELGMSSRLADYHIEALEREGRVQRVQEAGYSRFFPAVGKPKWARRDVEFICLMRRPVALRVVLLLLADGPTGQGDIARRLDLAKASASYHLGMLLDAGCVCVAAMGRTRTYSIRDPAYVQGMLANFTPIPQDLEGFARVWDDLFKARLAPAHNDERGRQAK